jgi:hypothetical protein
MDQLYSNARTRIFLDVFALCSRVLSLCICFIPSAVSQSSTVSALLGMCLLDSSLPSQSDQESYKIVARCAAPRGWRPALPRMRYRAPHAALHDYKVRVPLSLSQLCSVDPSSISIYFVALTLRFPGLLNPVPGPNGPARASCYAQSPPSDILHNDLGSLEILPRSTLLRLPLVLIRLSLHHTSLISGLAVTTTSMAYLVVSLVPGAWSGIGA